LPRTGSQTDSPQMKQSPVVQGVAGGCTRVRNRLAGVDGNRSDSFNHSDGKTRVATKSVFLHDPWD